MFAAALTTVAVGFAVEPEEVVVWGDRFARWRRRWYVETEVHFAQPQRLLAESNREIDLVQVQLRMVLDCGDEGEITANMHEARCAIEDVGIVGVPVAPRASDPGVLHETDAALTGADVQLQVSAQGGVPDLDLEAVDGQDARARERAEDLRQLVALAVLPFHIDIPAPIHEGMQWQETGSRLFAMPTEQGTMGGTVVSHFLNAIGPDHYVIQSVGEGHLSNEGPVPVVDSGGLWSWLPGKIYRSETHGVAVLEKATGILTERVWVVRAELTPASWTTSLRGGEWFHSGRLRMLGRDERVDVGGTWVSRNGEDPPDRPAWVALPP